MQRSLKSGTQSFRRGVSLIEILVVIVILLVGILSVIRLFPAGFLGIRNAENNTIANSLGEAQLDPLRDNVSAPDGVYASVLTSGTTLAFDPTVDPDDIGPYEKSTPASLNAYSDDINKTRYISREPVTVKFPFPLGNGTSASSYLPRFGPIYLPAAVYSGVGSDSAAESPFLNIVSAPWRPTLGDWRSTDVHTEDVLKSGHSDYLIDYNGGQIALPPETYSRTFSMNFQAIVSGSVNIYQIIMTVPASGSGVTSSTEYDGGWFTPSIMYITSGSGPAAGTPWVPNSATLLRPFNPVPVASFTADPYQFAVMNPNLAGTDCNIGTVQFNPLAATGDGGKPILGYISYNVFDWHILREDHDVPSGVTGSEGGTIRLAIPNVKRLGSTQYDQTSYQNIVPFIPGATPADSDHYDILMVDTDTGLELTSGSVGSTDTTNIFDSDDQSGAPPLTSAYWVSYGAGRISFKNLGSAFYAQHKHVRVFYRGTLDWGVALQKAPALFTYTGKLSDLTTVPLAATPSIYYSDGTGNMYFPPCTRTDVVHLGQVAYTDTNGASQIFDADAQVGSNGWINGGIPYIDLAALVKQDANTKNIVANYSDPIVVGYVRGESARSIVVWRDRDKLSVRTVDGIVSSAQ